MVRPLEKREGTDYFFNSREREKKQSARSNPLQKPLQKMASEITITFLTIPVAGAANWWIEVGFICRN